MGCFSPWQGDKGTFTVGLGPSGGDGGNGGTVEVGGVSYQKSNLRHDVTLSGGPGPDQKKSVKGTQGVHFSVTPGRWNIFVQAFDITTGEEIAVGSDRPEIKPGWNNPVYIKMGPRFVPVTGITDVPATAAKGFPLRLTTTVKVMPTNATNQTIVWTVDAESTGATITIDIDDGTATLNAPALGTVTVTATIADGKAVGTDFVQEFKIDVQEPGTPAITFAQIADVNAVISTTTVISLSGSDSIPRTAPFSVQGPEQYTDIKWYVPGTIITGSKPDFTLDSADFSVGQYYLTLEVRKDNRPYSNTVIFTVVP
jgi:hypothetical protein